MGEIMHVRKSLAFAALVVAIAAGTASVASAAPDITSHGVTNQVAWGLKSLQYTYFYAGVVPSNAWVKLEVVGGNGVVAKIYDGAVNKLGKDSIGRYWSPRWYGRDNNGKMLPTGVYNYQWTASSAGSSVIRKGIIVVSRVWWTITGAGPASAPDGFDRYLYGGKTRVFYHTYSAETTTTYMAVSAAWKSGSQDFADHNALNIAAGAWSPTLSRYFTAPIAHFYVWALTAAKGSDHDQLNGSKVQVTVVQ
jgi:hypothetical protein